MKGEGGDEKKRRWEKEKMRKRGDEKKRRWEKEKIRWDEMRWEEEEKRWEEESKSRGEMISGKSRPGRGGKGEGEMESKEKGEKRLKWSTDIPDIKMYTRSIKKNWKPNFW